MKIDDLIAEIPGMMFYISCVTGTETNIKGMRNGTKPRPGISYFLCGQGIEERLVYLINFNCYICKRVTGLRV